ncbi:Uncharacterised protein [Rothia dentocariosa]|jgi:hypothetical protein|uniref:Uncharacterized protein n=1 Tax=Rothia dentocariosa TaxID=2047 RepID=A0A448UXJ8_9MICC|nr:Uncharacterised protein [Rothia dentocariosa]
MVSRGVKTYKIPLLWNINVDLTNIHGDVNIRPDGYLLSK